jgi:hypothetical protein
MLSQCGRLGLDQEAAMRRALAAAAALTAVTLITLPLLAEVKLPQASPAARVELVIGTTKVEIVYHRPGVKDRVVWGGLVPYGTLWRLGANEATTIELSEAAKIAGHPVPEGKYALFAIPGKSSWTIILNSKSDQWGAYGHDQTKDTLRFDVQPKTEDPVEWMRFTIEPTGTASAEVAMHWAGLGVAFPIEVDVPGIVWGKLTKKLGEKDVEWLDYFQAARYSLDEGSHRDEALVWADRAMVLKPGFWRYELKARLLQRAGRTAEAVPLMEQAMADAKGKAPQEYVDGLAKTVAEWKKPAGQAPAAKP